MTNGASAAAAPMKAGLEDVVVSTTEICFIDGHKGRLVYRGYDVDDLVAHSTFEEVVFLLFHGRLPSRKELDAHLKTLAATANRKLPPKLVAMLKAAPEEDDPDGGSPHGRLRAVRLRSRCRRQLARGDAPEVDAAHRAAADPGRRLGADPTRQGAGGAEPETHPSPATSST